MRTVIITAGGIGKRMGHHEPKQFMLLGGRPVLMRTLERFFNTDPTFQLIITLPEAWITHWKQLLAQYNCTITHSVIAGGEERYHSIKAALAHAQGEYIAVHDGVRPLVSSATILAGFEAAEKEGAAIPVMPLVESLRQLTSEGSLAVPRNSYVTVQTPQCFESGILRSAYDLPFHNNITDDASLVEAAGNKIALFNGNEENIKITSPHDLRIAELFL